MTGPFETVSDIEDWLETEPEPADVEEAIEIEEDGPNRTTGLSALRQYLREVDDSGGDGDGVEFRVQRPLGELSPGDAVTLDPTSARYRRLSRDGYIER